MRKVIIALLTGILILLCVNVEGNAQCDWEPGDFNCNGTPLELSDIIAAVSNYRGISEACGFCDCGEFGEDFPVSADVDGNCIPYELSDLVAAISAYRRVIPEVLCPGCYHLMIKRPVPDPEK
jgi:hypothetical protein